MSLVPLLKGDAKFDRGPMFWHYPVAKPLTPLSEPGSVVRDGDWKFLYFYSDRRSELYNLKDDIGETNKPHRRHAGESGRVEEAIGFGPQGA